MKSKDYLVVALLPLPFLLIPLIGMQVSTEWNWGPGSFVFAWFAIAAATFMYKLLASRRGATLAFRAATVLAVLGGFLIGWGNLAVGFIGSEDNPANTFYFGVLLLGLVGVALSRFEARNLARTAFAMAAAMFLIPVAALAFWPSDFAPGVAQVFALNAAFVLLFVASGLLYRAAAASSRAATATSRG